MPAQRSPSFASSSSSSVARPTRTSSARPLPQPPMDDARRPLPPSPPANGSSQWGVQSRPSFGTMDSSISTLSAETFDSVSGRVYARPAVRVEDVGGYGSMPGHHRSASASTLTRMASPVEEQFQVFPSSDGHGLYDADSLTPPTTAALHRSVTGRTTQYGEEPIPDYLVPALLSNLAMFVKDRVPRSEHTRGSIPYAHSFTGQDVVTLVQRALPEQHKADRRPALHAARGLCAQFFFFDVRDGASLLADSNEQVFAFPDADDEPEFDQWEGSSRTGGRRRRAVVDDYAELPTAVLTELTPCYSPFCGRISATTGAPPTSCYSFTCPNGPRASLRRQASAVSEAPAGTSAAGGAIARPDNQWQDTVPPELMAYIGPTEVTRQSAIHELITGEMEFVRDLDLLRTEFVDPIMAAGDAIIRSDDQSTFFAEVLLNVFEVREHAGAFLEAMLERQREQAPVIQAMGDVCHAAARDWGPAYEQYLAESSLAEDRVKQERLDNPAFDQFLLAFPSRPATGKRDFSQFLTRVTFRVPRYTLLFDRIAEKTSVDNPDKHEMATALALVKAQATEANRRAAAAEPKLECRRYHRDLVPHPNTNGMVDLELLHEDRKIYHRGKMLRKPDGTTSGFTDWSDLHVILFDHFCASARYSSRADQPVVMTKPRAGRGPKTTKYHISRRIIPLELLSATGFDDPPQYRPSGFHLRPIGGSANASSAQAVAAPSSSSSERTAYPITFRHLGRRGGTFTLFVNTAAERETWKARLVEAITNREAVVERTKAFDLATVSDQTFLTRPIAPDPYARDSTRPPFGPPTCSVAFKTPEGHQLVAVGHEDGLWIGLRHDPSSFRLVLHLRCITQCSVLEDFALVLVLADKALYAYPLEALVPSAASAANMHRDKEPQKLSGTRDVIFFKAGKVGQRVLVIYVKRSGVNQTVFKALEPISVSDRAGPRGLLGRRRPDWFRTYRVRARCQNAGLTRA